MEVGETMYAVTVSAINLLSIYVLHRELVSAVLRNVHPTCVQYDL